MKSNHLLALGFFALGIGIYQMTKPKWTPPVEATPYLVHIQAAEYRHGMPPYLMARLLYQESRYRKDIITGQLVSGAGAVGIAQIVPKWHPGVDPLDPIESIYHAASYLAQQRDRFDSWKAALAAYNWGPTALNNAMKKYGSKWLKHAPVETQNYVDEILGDIA